VRRFLPRVINLLVTSLASLRSHVLGSIFRCTPGYIGGGCAGRGCAGGLSALSHGRWSGLAGSKGGDDENK
jgi:hypothetical protein